MKEDVVSLLDKLSNALSIFSKELIQGRDTDIVYGTYLNELLLHTAENYIMLKNELRNLPAIPYRNLFVILPGNVPMVFFEVLPISISYRIKTFFKFPDDEKTLYFQFIKFLKERYPKIGYLFEGDYISHEETEKKVNDFDFVFVFGSHRLKEFLSRIHTSYNFFGPGFSIGISFNSITDGILKDTLFFDQRGCLSMKFLFYKDTTIPKHLTHIFKEGDNRIPATSAFNKDRFIYRLYSLLPYGDIISKYEKSAIFEMKTKKLPDIPLPERTLIIKRISNEEDILDFFGKYAKNLQAIATDNPANLYNLKKYVSFTTEFGRLQFQPYNFLFKRGVTFKNIFLEVKDED